MNGYVVALCDYIMIRITNTCLSETNNAQLRIATQT